ncbi:MAG: phosphatase PAP2 family protein [Sulfuricaulis sp.]
MKWKSIVAWSCLALFCLISSGPAFAGGGPLGIDHVVSYDNSGIWKRKYQLDLVGLMIAGEITGAVWEGGETRLGKTYWQAIDSSVIGGLSAGILKLTFSRARPSQTSDPNKFFQGHGDASFPSGEVTAVSSIITPFVLEYHADYPAVYALELLPVYDMVARMKAHDHWQSDVLAGFALGTYSGYYAHSRSQPIILTALPHGFMVGLRERF